MTDIFQNKPKVAIVLLVWNDYENTKVTLDSILKFNYPSFEIYVVDNNSQDNCIELLKNDFGLNPYIRFIYNQENSGYAGGNNVGINIAMKNGSDYIFVLNNDLIFNEPNLLNKLIDVFEKDLTIGVLAPEIYNKKADGTFEKSEYKSDFYDMILTKFLKINTNYPSKNISIRPTVSGCFIGFRTQALRKVGLFNKNFFMYSEETELCFRFHLNNYIVCHFIDQSEVYHLGGTIVLEKLANWKKFLMIRNNLIMFNIFNFRLQAFFSFTFMFSIAKMTLKLIKKYDLKAAVIIWIAYFNGLYCSFLYDFLYKNNTHLYDKTKTVISRKRILGINIK